MAILTYVYMLAVFFIADSMQGQFLPCPGEPQPVSVDIDGCKTLPCNLRRGDSAEASVKFIAVGNTKTLRPVVHVDVDGTHVPFILPEQNACRSLTIGQCPLKKEDLAIYHLKMPVQRAYPLTSLTIQVELVGQHNQVHACFRIPANVVD